MFIKTNTFRRMLKEAYKNNSLKLAQIDERTLVIITGYQLINIDRDKLLPPEKACIIEFAGELPEVGEYFLCTEGGNQMEVFESLPDFADLSQKWAMAADYYEETYMICDWKGTLSRAVQNTATNEVIWYQEEFLRMIIGKPSRADEEFDRKLRVSDTWLMYHSNYMTIAILPIKLEHERLNCLLQNLELWKQEHEYDD